MAAITKLLLCYILCLESLSAGQPEVEQMIKEVRAASFPELSRANISVAPFRSHSTFLMAQFKPLPFLTGSRMKYVIRVNPTAETLGVPDAGLRAILAHELSHIVYYSQRKRIKLLGMVRLLSGDYRRKFERNTDLEAIRRGYGDGLKQYRSWLYRSIPPEAVPGKQKEYLTPDEIDRLTSP